MGPHCGSIFLVSRTSQKQPEGPLWTRLEVRISSRHHLGEISDTKVSIIGQERCRTCVSSVQAWVDCLLQTRGDWDRNSWLGGTWRLNFSFSNFCQFRSLPTSALPTLPQRCQCATRFWAPSRCDLYLLPPEPTPTYSLITLPMQPVHF